MARELFGGPTDNANCVLRHANDKLAQRVVIDHNAPIYRFLSSFRHTGANHVSPGLTGYGYGTGGIIRLRICPQSAGGTPNLAATVASESVAATTLHARRLDYSGSTTNSHGTYFLPRTPTGQVWTHPAGEAWWYVFDNVDGNPSANWISWNGVDMRPSAGGDTTSRLSYLGPNGVNFPFTARPANSYAIAGLDPREVIAWTTGGDNGSWQFGNVGGLAGASRAVKPGTSSTGYYDSPKLGTYGWTETSSAILGRPGWPFAYLGGGGTTGTALRGDAAKRAVTVTHVGSFHGTNPGTITFLNRTTGLSSTCSSFTTHNDGALRRGALAVPVVVNVGDNWELSCTNAITAYDPDSSSQPFYDVGQSRTYKWYKPATTTIDGAAMLFADPWPDYDAATAADTTPPTVTMDLTNGTVVTTTQLVTATASDPSGITKVEFYVDGQLVATDTSAPYQYTIDVSSGLWTNEVQTISGTPSASFGITFEGQAGGETLATNASAASIDTYLEALSNIGSGGVSCSGGPLPSAVTVTFNGTNVAGRNLSEMTIAGSATGVNFATTTDGAGYGPPGSTHTLTARAYDTAGNTAEVSRTFQAGVVGVDNTLPVLTVNLGDGTTLTGASNTITATATDASGIQQVDFYVDGTSEGFLIATDTSSPFTCNIDATAYTPGTTHSLHTRVIDNPGFLTANQMGVETDATGFTGDANTTVARTTAQAHSGSASLRATAIGTGVTEAGTPTGTSGFRVGSPPVAIRAGCWIRPTTAGTTFTVSLMQYDINGNLLGSFSGGLVLTQNVWTRIMIGPGVVVPTAAFCALRVTTSSLTAGQTWDMDDLVIGNGTGITRTFQAAGTPPNPTPDPCATVEAALLTVTAERDAAITARDAAITARDLAITQRDAALLRETVLSGRIATALAILNGDA